MTMKRREIDVPPNDAARLVHDVLELAAICVADLKKTSLETDAPKETVKISELAHIIKLLDEVHARHQSPVAPPSPAASHADECLTKAERDVVAEIEAKVVWSRGPKPLPEPQEGMAADLQAIAEMEIAKLLSEARTNAFGLLRPQELVSLLELTLRLPPPPPETPLVADVDALSVPELVFMLYVHHREQGDEHQADVWRQDIERNHPDLGERVWG